MSTDNNAQQLAAYRKRLQEAGFKRISAYVSVDLILFLRSQRMEGECMGRTFERLLLGSARTRPQYHSDEKIKQKQVRKREAAVQRAQALRAARG